MTVRSDEPPLSGVLVVDKPEGPTSHDVVDRARRALGTRRVGHTGTLDPLATGVLPLCIGKATRLARFLTATEKVYAATVRFGFATSTDDREGEPLGEPRSVRIEEAELKSAARSFVGDLLQLPPVFSAKRVSGRRLYALAREGEEVPRKAVPVKIHSIDVLQVEGSTADIAVACSPGTYLRALARDLGAALGVGAHLLALRRTRSGSFGLEGALSWDDLGRDPTGHMTPMSALLADLPSVTVEEGGLEAVRHGRDLSEGAFEVGALEALAGERVRILGPGGELLALAIAQGFEGTPPGLTLARVLHPDVVLVD